MVVATINNGANLTQIFSVEVINACETAAINNPNS